MAMNWNVKLALWFTFISTAARGVWAWVTLSLYLKSLTGATFDVGLSEGIQGGVQAFVAVIAGVYADRFRRDHVLRVGGLLGLIAIGMTAFALMIPDKVLIGHEPEVVASNSTDSAPSDDQKHAATLRYLSISIALGLWGMYQGVWNTVMETVFADSVKTGDRSKFNTRKFMLLQASSVVGPIVAIAIFSLSGNTWYHVTLRNVFLTGAMLCIPGALLLMFFRDDHALGEESQGHAVGSSEPPTRRPSKVGGFSKDEEELVKKLADVAGKLERYNKPRTCCGMTARKIPHILVFSDLISGLASGMTIKFFPLYFAKEIYLEPVPVQGIYIALPFFMIVVSKSGQMISKRIGRVTTSIIMAYIGSAALIGLFCIEFFAKWGCYECPQEHGTTEYMCTTGTELVAGEPVCNWSIHDDNSWTCLPIDCKLRDYWYIALGLYFLSTFQHCCRPLKKSILMDFTEKKTRAKWNSLDSVTRFGWSGSAVVGGYLIEKYSYGTTFLVTAFAQIVSASMLFMLIPLMGSDHENKVDNPPGSFQEPAEAEAGKGHSESSPLLINK